MANILAEPRRPVTDWHAKLDAWVSQAEEIVHQASIWAKSQGWATSQDEKVISEDLIGTYKAPRLLIHRTEGRLLLDPVARYVLGAAGRFDFCVIPSYDSVALVNAESGWRFFSKSQTNLDLPWTEESFVLVSNELLKKQ